MAAVRIREVLPRDGFQDLDVHLPAATKIAIIEELAGAGLDWIEVTSMVSPRWVPQFTDAEEVLRAVRAMAGIEASVFVPNRRGLERLLSVGADEVSLAVASTDELAKENFAKDRDETVAEVIAVATQAEAEGLRSSVSIGGSFGCPYRGEVQPAEVVELAKRLAASPVGAIFVADTIGVGTKQQAAELTAAVREVVPAEVDLGIHLHGGDASAASVLAAVEAGATVADSSTTGAGGCPFVPEAPGNVSTESLVAALAGAGIETPVDAPALLAAGARISSLIEEARKHERDAAA
jgi:hydroxymethylglutaryl-CoA lyase